MLPDIEASWTCCSRSQSYSVPFSLDFSQYFLRMPRATSSTNTVLHLRRLIPACINSPEISFDGLGHISRGHALPLHSCGVEMSWTRTKLNAQDSGRLKGYKSKGHRVRAQGPGLDESRHRSIVRRRRANPDSMHARPPVDYPRNRHGTPAGHSCLHSSLTRPNHR